MDGCKQKTHCRYWLEYSRKCRVLMTIYSMQSKIYRRMTKFTLAFGFWIMQLCKELNSNFFMKSITWNAYTMLTFLVCVPVESRRDNDPSLGDTKRQERSAGKRLEIPAARYSWSYWLHLFRRKSAFSHFYTWLHTWLMHLAKCNFCKIF